ncbi:hypothetical protein [Arthrobacter sp. efr-133-R2A-120]|uniref:hypothetical protein n=1 Tax=Arthrobacter sp. efr-133-R2A-120 TaxID=3040277 RepID=UPI00254E41AA|nr:hypothetical protein [Arthrobacter sp. efr-133-R2A-120]
MGILITIVVFFVLMFCLAGWLGFALFIAGDRSQKRAEANAPAILDKAFVGDDVVFKINQESPRYETVVLGAKARGYRLANETNNTASGDVKTLIFEKIWPST